jgi:nifR3 family TIM-barrel protein
MDGITDYAFRKMITSTAKADVSFTEFVNTEGLSRGALKMLSALQYDTEERPVVAQIYGTEIESFYTVALMLCFLGFDGIDINMGCPMKKIEKRGAGAGLIRTPDHAKLLINTVKQAIQDFVNGKELKDAGVRPKLISAIQKMNPNIKERKPIPVSVKTRIGIDSNIALEWSKHLLSCDIAHLSLHGRTLQQLYSGEADWETIGKVAKLCKKTETSFFGNGDILSKQQGEEYAKTYGTDGVLIGRAFIGNPWLLRDTPPSLEERIQGAITHCEIFTKKFPDTPFFVMRKHLSAYTKGFINAKETRVRLMTANNLEEVKSILFSSSF